ncbi:MAG: DUF1849 family protein [Proteobacteria bacterium]|nr:DUF1849 family protein [Pseudomonadota bacterium]
MMIGKKVPHLCSFVGLVMIAALFLPSCAWAALEGASAPARIVPHKAYYKLVMGSKTNSSALDDVTGTILFDWQNSCDGWTSQQYISFAFSYADGTQAQIKSTMMSWESMDGKDMTFYIKRQSDADEEENYKGKAHMDEQGGVVKFSMPENTPDLTLPKDTMYPTNHTFMILQKALAGEKMFTRRVYDGSQAKDVDEVSVFIAPELKEIDKDIQEKYKGNGLIGGRAWPVRLAFYRAADQTSAPDYEMEMEMQENGVVRKVKIEYPDFTITGSLDKLEPNETLSCGAKNGGTP